MLTLFKNIKSSLKINLSNFGVTEKDILWVFVTEKIFWLITKYPILNILKNFLPNIQIPLTTFIAKFG